MQTLWADLNDSIDSIPVSESEKELLDRRLARLKSGEAKILDWDDVKGQIGKGC